MSDPDREARLRGELAASRADGTPLAWYGEDASDLDLHGELLREATLIDARLDRARLDDADLSHALAGGASFEAASLVRADLTKAALVAARFDRANAREARFVKADLAGAAFAAAELTGAIFDGATCRGTSFRSANLTRASLWTATLVRCDLRDSVLDGTRFDNTFIELSTRFDGCRGLDRADVVSIVIGNRTLSGDEARAWLASRVDPLPWSVEDFELYLLSKMSGPTASEARRRLCPDPAARDRIVADVATVFDRLPHAAIDYERVLGTPRDKRRFDAGPPFAGSLRSEFLLPLWPEVVFVVNTDADGLPWGVAFEGGRDRLPDDPRAVEPWQYTAPTLRALATDATVLEHWDHELSMDMTIGGQRFHARFDMGLLQQWEPAR